jgi:hypothetical protein
LESWNKLVIQRSGEYSQRLKSAHRTRESGSSSWPTISVNESKNSVGKSQEHRNSIPLGTMAAMQDAANWLTPQSGDVTGSTRESVVMWANGQRPKTSDQRLRTQVAAEQLKHGQAAPANPSTDGSRQGLWRTPSVAEEKNQNTSTQIYLQNQVGATPKAWATPNAFCYQPPENTEQWTKRAEYQQTEKGVNLHKPVQSQVLHENEKVMGAMPPSAGKLNPRWVETLMGLPVGWTMPSCKSPVTIEPTNFASSATE